MVCYARVSKKKMMKDIPRKMRDNQETIAVATVLGIAGVCVFGSLIPYGRGRHVGRINAMHHRGLLFKTHEIEFLRTRNITDADGGVLQVSIPMIAESPKQLEEIATCMDNNTAVEIRFRRFLWNVLPWRGETCCHLESVRPLQ